jgi:protein-S-isoprenylcysteine O-methyltransferase Ste14
MAMAMAANPFLESTVRIQKDRSHVVVTAGPYRIVRHPMYVGALVMFAAWPLLLGSAWSFVPLAAMVPALVVRTALEDRMLQRELAGFADYAQRTRYRLLPGVW